MVFSLIISGINDTDHNNSNNNNNGNKSSYKSCSKTNKLMIMRTGREIYDRRKKEMIGVYVSLLVNILHTDLLYQILFI